MKCYAFEPPGCIFDDKLASNCEDFITSIVCNDDVVPRLTTQNLDMLRDDFFDVLAQIKVPKIKAIRDVCAPCSDSHLKMRNGNVLCPKAQIDRDTEFWQKVVKFRNERASKNAASMKLYIAGRIIYLVDTKGEESKYIAYWASRYEFQSIKVSSKMISDHVMHTLVKTLRSLDLDDTCHNEMEMLRPNEFSEKDESVDYRTFICCSMPNGIKRTISAMLLSFAAWILAVISNESCSFAEGSDITITDVDMSYKDATLAYGMWSFIPKSRGEDGRLQNAAYCFPYPREYNPGSHVTTARVFSIFSLFVGFIVIGLLFISTAMEFKKSAQITTTSMAFAACLFQSLQLLFLQSNFCSGEQPIVAAGQSIVVDGECHLSTGGFFSIASIALWFASGLVCSTLFCMS